MGFDFDVCSLSETFYKDYPQSQFPEILRKSDRPYTCLLVDCHCEYLICIPFRSSIKHNEAFHFSGTNRSKKSRSGLDYKKVILIKNEKYINSANAVVDADEYTMMVKNIDKIVREINQYIGTYISHVKKSQILHEREYNRKYGYSTLPYFHDILEIA